MATPGTSRTPPVPLLVALLLGLADTGRAAGLGIPDLGATAIGQGAALVARPPGIEAIYYNPAALAALDGVRVQLDTRMTNHEVRFQRLEPDGTNPREFEPVINDGGLALGLDLHASVAPLGGVSVRVARSPFPITLAIGGHPASGYTGYHYADPAELRRLARGREEEVARLTPQRYMSIRSDSKIFAPALAAGAQLADWLALGATLQVPIAFFDTSQALYAFTSPGEDSTFDAAIRIEAADPWTVSGVLGIGLQLPWGLLAGAALQLPWSFEAKGKIHVTVPEPLARPPINARVIGDAVDLSFTFPWTLRTGLRLVRDAFEVELAGTYERWSMLDKMVLDPKGRVAFELLGQQAKLPRIEIEKNLEDAGSLRMGVELKPGAFRPDWSWLTLRVGVLRETSAVPMERQALDMLHWERWSAGAGLGLSFGRYELSLGYAHFFQERREVRQSKVLQVVAIAGLERAVVGAGDYDSHIDLAAMMLSAKFDPWPAPEGAGP